MKVTSFYLVILFIAIAGCVERYYPDDEDIISRTLVVNAHLFDSQEKQYIAISRSDKLVHPEFIPETNCIVTVEDHKGNSTNFNEEDPGVYGAIPEEGFFTYGNQYQLTILNDQGVLYRSDYESLRQPQAIDSIYYELEKRTGEELSDTTYGIRFYIDYDLDTSKISYNRWEIVETYEHKTPNYRAYIYDVDRVVKPLPDELSDRHCYITDTVPKIFVQSAKQLSGQKFKKQPLHYVSNESQRLHHRYSILVKQYALSHTAYLYWNELEKNSSAGGGLFDSQPAILGSNICNCENEEERVIGFFTVSGVTEKRIFVDEVDGLEIPDNIFCFPGFEPPRFRFIPSNLLPTYLASAVWPEDGKEYFGETQHHCVDCRILRGSAGDPPEYW